MTNPTYLTCPHCNKPIEYVEMHSVEMHPVEATYRTDKPMAEVSINRDWAAGQMSYTYFVCPRCEQDITENVDIID